MTQYQEKIVGKPGGLVEPGVKQYGFFKKIFKPVKKIAKKVWKSPLGKAALLGGGLYGLGSLAGGAGGWSNFGALGSKVGGWFGKNKLLSGLIRNKAGDYSLGKMGLMGLLGAGVALPFMGGDDEEEEVQTPWENTPASIANIAAMARNRDPSLSFLPQNAYTQSGFYAADGGLARLANGGGVAEAQAEQMLKMQYQKYRNQGGTMSYQQFKMTVLKQAQSQGPMAQEHLQAAAKGGRIGYQRGSPPGGGDPGMRGTGQSYGSSYGPGRDTGWSPGVGGTQHIPTHRPAPRVEPGSGVTNYITDQAKKVPSFGFNLRVANKLNIPYLLAASGTNFIKDRFLNRNKDDDEASLPSGYDFSGIEGQTAKNIGPALIQQRHFEKKSKAPDIYGTLTSEEEKMYKKSLERDREEIIYKMPVLTGAQGGRVGAQEGGIMDLGGMEKDYRQEGGFVPLGKEEKADDVPARLSKNEFVFTADAVKAAGGGDIDAGAEVMQNMMNNLEEGGEISEESQGAQGMYNQQQMLQSRMA